MPQPKRNEETNMTHSERNSLFTEKEPLIRMTMCKHSLLIYFCRMDRNDVYQELAIRLIESLDKFDAAKCKNLDAYLMQQLRYRLLHMRDNKERFGISGAPQKGFSMLSLEALPFYDPECCNDNSNPIWIEQEIEKLPPNQYEAITRLLSGRRINRNNRNLIAARRHFRLRRVEHNLMEA